jgi:branched-chain amino acid transport system substrate-binding protein
MSRGPAVVPAEYRFPADYSNTIGPAGVLWQSHSECTTNLLDPGRLLNRLATDLILILPGVTRHAFGYALEKDTSDLITAKGGKVLGSVRIPLNSSDFSSFLLQTQSSNAKIIGLANAGLDTTNSIKQAAEFGIVKGGQKLAGLLLTLAEVHGLGLEAAQGLVLTEGYYWDRDDKSRDLANRFFKRTGRMPNMIQAGTYSATLQYLKAVKAAGTKDSDAVAKKLKELPVDDSFAQGKVLENGRMVHDLYLFEVKKPSESKKPWDYYKQLAVVPGDKAFPSAKDSGCPLTK